MGEHGYDPWVSRHILGIPLAAAAATAATPSATLAAVACPLAAAAGDLDSTNRSSNSTVAPEGEALYRRTLGSMPGQVQLPELPWLAAWGNGIGSAEASGNGVSNNAEAVNAWSLHPNHSQDPVIRGMKSLTVAAMPVSARFNTLQQQQPMHTGWLSLQESVRAAPSAVHAAAPRSDDFLAPRAGVAVAASGDDPSGAAATAKVAATANAAGACRVVCGSAFGSSSSRQAGSSADAPCSTHVNPHVDVFVLLMGWAASPRDVHALACTCRSACSAFHDPLSQAAYLLHHVPMPLHAALASMYCMRRMEVVLRQLVSQGSNVNARLPLHGGDGGGWRSHGCDPCIEPGDSPLLAALRLKLQHNRPTASSPHPQHDRYRHGCNQQDRCQHGCNQQDRYQHGCNQQDRYQHDCCQHQHPSSHLSERRDWLQLGTSAACRAEVGLATAGSECIRQHQQRAAWCHHSTWGCAHSTTPEGVVRLLLSLGADPNLPGGHSGARAFMPAACSEGHNGSSNANANNHSHPHPHAHAQGPLEFISLTQHGITPLMLAAATCPAALRPLLAAGADPRVNDPAGQTALAIAAALAGSGGSSMDEPSMDQQASTLKDDLHVHQQHPVGLLLSAGARVCVPRLAGRPPLLWATDQGNVAAVQALLAAGADPNELSDSRHSALFAALSAGMRCKGGDSAGSPSTAAGSIAASTHGMHFLGVVHALLDAGACAKAPRMEREGGADAPCADACAPLALAVRWRHLPHAVQLVQRLLAAGADPNVADEDGCSPLMQAVQRGSTEMVHALLHAGARANAAARVDGTTPLMVAAVQGHMGVVQALLHAGANVGACKSMRDGRQLVTAVQMAEACGHGEVADVLRRALNAQVHALLMSGQQKQQQQQHSGCN